MSFQRYRERSRDIQDGVERHVWGEQEYQDKKGSVIKVRGTDTNDEEAAVLNIAGSSFNMKKDSNSEVMLISSSSDTTLKMALLTIPKDKQRRWQEGMGGVQHQSDPEVGLQFSDKRSHILKNKFAVGQKGEVEIDGDKGYLRVSKLIVDGELIVNKEIKTPKVSKGSEAPPNFEGEGQAKPKFSADGQLWSAATASDQYAFDFPEDS